MSEAKAEYLAKILLIQNLVGQLPDEGSIFGFTCRGLMDLPGIAQADFVTEEGRTPNRAAAPHVGTPQRFPVILGGAKYGDLELIINDREAFQPYESFVSNVCFMISLVLEERWQRRIIQRHQEELEEKVKERTLQLSEEKELLAVTLRSIGDGVITTDMEGRVTHLNKIAEHLTGWRHEEAAGRPLPEVFNILNSESKQPCENPAAKVLATGLNSELENHTMLRDRSGVERPVADSAAPIRDRQSRTIGVVIVFRDMTERQKMQESMQRNERLDALGVLAGGIAHDFNNLLAGLFGYLDLARETAENAEALDSLERALAVFERAKNLTQQLLTFSKGGSPVKKTATIAPLLRDCTTFALSGSSITQAFDIEPTLPLCDFDPNQLAQVVDNMVINAKQAMPNGGSILVSARAIHLASGEKPGLRDGDHLCISISDTGAGIPPDKLPRIFDPFYTTKETGSGLGLATCHSIIQRHDGLIEVDSTVGKGTTFRILLPASRGKQKGSEAQSFHRHSGSGLILVMDDEEFLREVMTRMLRAMGYEVESAAHGEAAIALWQAHAVDGAMPFNAVFLDLTIRGGMGGLQTLKELRARGARLPIFATSGYSGDPIMAKPREFDFTASLVKPFTLPDFSAFMDRHMTPPR